jgi:hypothetical protein
MATSRGSGKRKRLIGCGAFLGFKLIVLLLLAGFWLYRAGEAGVGLDVFLKQPALAAAAIGVMAHSDFEFVSLDKYRGTLTLRQVSSGQTSTLRPEQVLRPDVLESGRRIGILFGQSSDDAGLPAWVPTYPGSRSQGVVRQDAPGIQKGVASFEAFAAAGRIADYYVQAFDEAGFDIERLPEGSTTTVNGGSGDGTWEVEVVVSSLGAKSSIRVTFGERRGTALNRR